MTAALPSPPQLAACSRPSSPCGAYHATARRTTNESQPPWRSAAPPTASHPRRSSSQIRLLRRRKMTTMIEETRTRSIPPENRRLPRRTRSRWVCPTRTIRSIYRLTRRSRPNMCSTRAVAGRSRRGCTFFWNTRVAGYVSSIISLCK